MWNREVSREIPRFLARATGWLVMLFIVMRTENGEFRLAGLSLKYLFPRGQMSLEILAESRVAI